MEGLNKVRGQAYVDKQDYIDKQAVCCKCYWNDQCCNGCDEEQEDCDDFILVYEDELEYLEYIEETEYKSDIQDRVDYYQELLDEMEGDA
jgi:hypothetical protein